MDNTNSEVNTQYQKIMGAYKVARRDPSDLQKAQTLLRAAQELRKSGKVSADVIEGCRYI